MVGRSAQDVSYQASKEHRRAHPAIIRLLCASGVWLVIAHWHGVIDAPDMATGRTDRLWMMCGIGLWLAALALNRGVIRPTPFTLRAPHPGTGFWPLTLVGVGVLVWLTVRITPHLDIAGQRVGPPDPVPLGRDAQLLAFFGGLSLFVIGMLPRDALRSLRDSVRAHWPEWLLVAGLTGFALGVRLYRLDSLIPMIQSDEPPFLFQTRKIVDGAPAALAQDMYLGQSYLGGFLMSYSIDLLGPTIFAGRLGPALVGTLAIPGVYMMARRMCNPLAGALAALCLAGQPVHVYFSRTVLYNIWDPSLGVYAVLLVWDGLERGGRWKFACAGVLIGICQYFYTAAQLWPVLVGLWLLVTALRQPRAMRHHTPHLLILGAGFVLAVLPLLAHIKMGTIAPTRHSLDMSQGYGSSEAALDASPREFVYEWVAPAVRAFIDYGDHSPHYEINPSAAIVLQLGFVAFALGVAYALRFALNPRVLFVLMWLGLATLFGGTLTHYVGFTRYVTALLPLAVLSGIGVTWLAAAWLPRPLYVIAAILLMMGVTTQDLYFILHTHPQRLIDQSAPERWIGDALAKATLEVPKENSTIIWITTPYAWNTRLAEIYGYYNGAPNYITMDQPVTWDWLATLDTRCDLYIFVPPVPGDSPGRLSMPAPDSPIWLILDAFPNASVTRYNGFSYPTDNPTALYALVHVPRGSANLAQ